MPVRKRPASGTAEAAAPAAEAAAPAAKRKKREEGCYAQHKGQSIPEPRLERPKAAAAGFKAICWNVGGLRAVLQKRGQDLQKLVQEEQPAVLGILEHKLQEGSQVADVTQELRELLPEYDTAVFSCSKEKKGYSGAAVLVHRSVSSQAEVRAEKLEKGADEGRTVCVEFPKLFVVVCYVPNSGEKLVRLKERVEHWDPKLAGYLQGLAKGKPVLLLGDLNVAHRTQDIWNAEAPHVPKSASTTPEERAGFGKLLEAGFVDGFAHQHPEAMGAFTYWSVRAGNRKPNRGLRLDYAMVSAGAVDQAQSGVQLVDAFHLPAYAPGGDHCPVGATLSGV